MREFLTEERAHRCLTSTWEIRIAPLNQLVSVQSLNALKVKSTFCVTRLGQQPSLVSIGMSQDWHHALLKQIKLRDSEVQWEKCDPYVSIERVRKLLLWSRYSGANVHWFGIECFVRVVQYPSTLSIYSVISGTQSYVGCCSFISELLKFQNRYGHIKHA